MQLTPRYDDIPALDLRLDPDAIRTPFLTQRRRLAATVDSLTDEQLQAPSRCDGWRVADVLTHLIDVDRFWGFSAASGLAGASTQVLESFDPEASPKAMTEGWRDTSLGEIRQQFVDGARSLCDQAEALEGDWADVIAESPPGHVTLKEMLAHAVWDAWIHEHDICVPLGLDVDQRRDELLAVLAYSSVLSPALGLMFDDDCTGAITFRASDLDLVLAVTVTDRVAVATIVDEAPDDIPVVEATAAELIEGLCQRASFDFGLDERDQWLVDGLAVVFSAEG